MTTSDHYLLVLFWQAICQQSILFVSIGKMSYLSSSKFWGCNFPLFGKLEQWPRCRLLILPLSSSHTFSSPFLHFYCYYLFWRSFSSWWKKWKHNCSLLSMNTISPLSNVVIWYFILDALVPNIGLAKKFAWVFHMMLPKNPNKLFGQTNVTWMEGYMNFFDFNHDIIFST